MGPDKCAGMLDCTIEYANAAQIKSSSVFLDACTSQNLREYFIFCSKYQNSTGIEVPGYENLYATGQVCNTTYLSTHAPVTVINMASNSRVSVDQDVLASAKVIEDMTIMNITAFEQEFISQTGSNHLRPTLGNGNYLGNSLFNTEFEGPALVSAATKDNDVDSLMQMDPVEVVRQATIIKQRFLGEARLSTINEMYQENSSHTLRGSITTEQVRLIASRGVGIVMGSIFWFWLSQLQFSYYL